ncbi:MAG: N-glycosylase/DNA lyase [Candidatus Omnitrophica bacterium]|nr:N-glycosylase/DNA lyase [Candidatus Omnitrophota bacterium]
MMKELIAGHARKKDLIKRRLRQFKKTWNGTEKKIFSELCFCICTPQSRAVYCDKAVSRLERSGTLFTGTVRQIRKGLEAVRFPNNKARYIVGARKLFTTDGSIRIKDKIDPGDILKTRDWLVMNVKGLGYKEASHFLRNIGFGRGLAILDVHIIRNLIRYGVVEEAPSNLSRARYLRIEEKMRKFSQKIDIPMEELDLLFWSEETGEIFK